MNLSGMPQAEPTTNIITNDGFYPDLDIADLINGYEIPNEYAANEQLLINTVITAIGEINDLLSNYQAANWYQKAKLVDVESTIIGGKSLIESFYKRAVFCNAKSKLLISKLSQTHRDKGAAQQISAIENQDHWLMQSDHAIRQILGVSQKITIGLV